MTRSPLPRSGEGTIGRGTARVLTVAFLAIILAPMACQPRDRGIPSFLQDLPKEWLEQGFQPALKGLEIRMQERRSVFVQAVRVPYRAALLRWLNESQSNARTGEDEFLFYDPDLAFNEGEGPLSARLPARIAEARDRRGDAFEETVRDIWRRLGGSPPVEPAVSRPYVDAATAIHDALGQFKARGIPVLVVPIPGKVSIYPEYFAPSYALAAGPAENRDLPRWRELLKSDGVSVVDLVMPLWQAKGRTQYPLFLKTDSHWSPDGLAIATDVIAAAAHKVFQPARTIAYATRKQTVTMPGDMLALLDVGRSYGIYRPETFTQLRVLHGYTPETTGDKAPVLLLGDSYTTMYAGVQPDSGAGLPAQLMLRLGCGVQTLAEKGIHPATLLHTIAARPAILDQKKLVVWTFSDRKVDDPDAWELVQLPAR